MFDPKNIDKLGMVRVFDLESGEYRRCWPIDAREMIKAGTATLHKPEPDDPPEIPTATDPSAESKGDTSNSSDGDSEISSGSAAGDGVTKKTAKKKATKASPK